MTSVYLSFTKDIDYSVNEYGEISFLKDLDHKTKNAITFHEGLNIIEPDDNHKGPFWKDSLALATSNRVTLSMVGKERARKLYKLALGHFDESYPMRSGKDEPIYNSLNFLIKKFRVDRNTMTANPELHLLHASSFMGDVGTVNSFLFPHVDKSEETHADVYSMLDGNYKAVSPFSFAVNGNHSHVLEIYLKFYRTYSSVDSTIRLFKSAKKELSNHSLITRDEGVRKKDVEGVLKVLTRGSSNLPLSYTIRRDSKLLKESASSDSSYESDDEVENG